jgi:hypothetical protein
MARDTLPFRLILGFIAGALGAGLYVVSLGSRNVEAGLLPGAGRPFMSIFDRSAPLMVPGEEVSMTEASSGAKYEVVEPRELPSETSRSGREVWLAADTREVGLRYGSELVVTFREWPPGTNAGASYETQAKEWDAGFTTTLGGKPAWIIPAGDRGPGEPEVNIIQVTREGLDITFYGTMSLEELQKTAESLP